MPASTRMSELEPIRLRWWLWKNGDYLVCHGIVMNGHLATIAICPTIRVRSHSTLASA